VGIFALIFLGECFSGNSVLDAIDAWRLNKASWLVENIDSVVPKENKGVKQELLRELDIRNACHPLISSFKKKTENGILTVSYRIVFILPAGNVSASTTEHRSKIIEDTLVFSVEDNPEKGLMSFSTKDVTDESIKIFEKLSNELSDKIASSEGNDRARLMVEKAFAMWEVGKVKELYELLNELLINYNDKKLEQLAKHFVGEVKKITPIPDNLNALHKL